MFLCDTKNEIDLCRRCLEPKRVTLVEKIENTIEQVSILLSRSWNST